MDMSEPFDARIFKKNAAPQDRNTRGHATRKFTGKTPDTNPGATVLCEPAQSKRTWSHGHFRSLCGNLWKFTRKMAGVLCEPARGHAHGHVRRTILCRNLKEYAGHGGYPTGSASRRHSRNLHCQDVLKISPPRPVTSKRTSWRGKARRSKWSKTVHGPCNVTLY